MGNLAQPPTLRQKRSQKLVMTLETRSKSGFSLYEAFEWIYGPEAFGLRLVAWFARKTPDAVIDGWLLGVLRLRAVPDAIVLSEQIAEMAKQAKEVRDFSKRLEYLLRHDSRYKQVLDPKRIRAAFADQINLKRWKEQVRHASVRALDALWGAKGHDSQTTLTRIRRKTRTEVR